MDHVYKTLSHTRDILLLLNSGQYEDIGSHDSHSDQILKRNSIQAFSPCHIHEEIRNRLLFYTDHAANVYTLHYKMLLKSSSDPLHIGEILEDSLRTISTIPVGHRSEGVFQNCTKVFQLTVYQAGHVEMDNYNLSYTVPVRINRKFEFRILKFKN